MESVLICYKLHPILCCFLDWVHVFLPTTRANLKIAFTMARAFSTHIPYMCTTRCTLIILFPCLDVITLCGKINEHKDTKYWYTRKTLIHTRTHIFTPTTYGPTYKTCSDFGKRPTRISSATTKIGLFPPLNGPQTPLRYALRALVGRGCHHP